MLNYNGMANTEDFSCIPFVYGCTDSTALNYDTLANTENGSCIEIIVGCMDLNAYNYDPLANVNYGHDSLGCLYAADWCVNGSGNPFYLNDECYAWVISVDDYCCTNEWDTLCKLTYDHCALGIPKPESRIAYTKKLIAITDILGRPSKEIPNTTLFYIYDDGTAEKRIIKINNYK
jgi:hypothetical protein